jgi:hypothetical protein
MSAITNTAPLVKPTFSTYHFHRAVTERLAQQAHIEGNQAMTLEQSLGSRNQ